MAYIIDEDLARYSSCHGYVIKGKDGKPDELLLYSPGAIGMLSDEQEDMYCSAGIETKPIEEAPALEKRVKGFKRIATYCSKEDPGVTSLPKGTRLPSFLACMSRELEKEGIEV